MRQQRAAAMSSARAAREREQRKGKGVRARESEGERQGGAWRHLDASGRLGGKQEVARAASAPATELLRCEGRKTTGGGNGGGLGRWRSWAGWAER